MARKQQGVWYVSFELPRGQRAFARGTETFPNEREAKQFARAKLEHTLNNPFFRRLNCFASRLINIPMFLSNHAVLGRCPPSNACEQVQKENDSKTDQQQCKPRYTVSGDFRCHRADCWMRVPDWFPKNSKESQGCGDHKKRPGKPFMSPTRLRNSNAQNGDGGRTNEKLDG